MTGLVFKFSAFTWCWRRWRRVEDDFAPSKKNWVLAILARDLTASLVPVLFPSDGATQLTLLSYVAITYVTIALICRPYVEQTNQTNSVLECWTIATIFLTFNYVGTMGSTAACGIDSSPFDDGKKDSAYVTRTWWLVVL